LKGIQAGQPRCENSMAKRIFIVHGWGGSPRNDWVPWAKRELEKRGYRVYAPEMPDTEHPKIKAWVTHLAKKVGEADKNTILVGHSIGCQTILRYLQTLPEDRKVDKVILIAGWGGKLILDIEEEEEIAKPWLETPIDYASARKKANLFIAIFSDNDPYVPLKENAELYKEKLGAKIIIEKRKGHFNEGYGIKKLPVLMKILEWSTKGF